MTDVLSKTFFCSKIYFWGLQVRWKRSLWLPGSIDSNAESCFHSRLFLLILYLYVCPRLWKLFSILNCFFFFSYLYICVYLETRTEQNHLTNTCPTFLIEEGTFWKTGILYFWSFWGKIFSLQIILIIWYASTIVLQCII